MLLFYINLKAVNAVVACGAQDIYLTGNPMLAELYTEDTPALPLNLLNKL